MSGSVLKEAGEWGGRLPVALVFPERERVALSTLGWQMVYQQLSADDGFYVQRFFLSQDMTRACSPDTGRALVQFPLICFSLNFEGDFPNIIKILNAEGIPLYADQRSDWPVIMAGGPVAFLNPYPLLPGFDFIFVGESEAGFSLSARVIRDCWLDNLGSKAALEQVKTLPGILTSETGLPVKRLIMPGLTGTLEKPAFSTFVSGASVFKDSLLLEVNRGCPYGCRFCAAGFIYRPHRQSRLEDLKKLVREQSPGKVGLVGTALTDWADLKHFLHWLYSKGIKFSLSSMRASGLDEDFLQFLRRAGARSITLAVEGISQRIRTAINKNFDEDIFFQVVKNLSTQRYNTLKLYFILGLPGEEIDDFNDLSVFLKRLNQARKEGMGNRHKGLDLINISVSMFVPKPWTPLQWSRMDKENFFNEKVKIFKKMCTGYKGLRFQAEKPFAARVQGLLSKGDEKLYELIILAAETGSWKKALREWPGRMEEYIDQDLSLDQSFVWDGLDVGVSKSYLMQEWEKYFRVMQTKPCPDTGCLKCRRCGMEKFM
ncbi:radical SAM protein [Desulfonatronovibrio magnus]|uniref:radical SAM protein n=1 Tax=Desulfonatronovibrio magnus TaxID=698827 RepID=UPI00069707A5|nr:radical SAM protein [Desulfonatronovibrio magnus]